MDNLRPAMTAEEKLEIEARSGLKEWKPTKPPTYANPYHINYHLYSLPVFMLSLLGYLKAPSMGLSRLPYTLNLIVMPPLYFHAVHNKEKRFQHDSGPRRTLEQHLEVLVYLILLILLFNMQMRFEFNNIVLSYHKKSMEQST